MRKAEKSLLKYNYNLFKNYGYDDIYEAYERPSLEKVRIWNKIREEYSEKCDTFNMRVLTRNTFHFTVGIVHSMKEDMPFDDNVLYFSVITPTYHYICYIIGDDLVDIETGEIL